MYLNIFFSSILSLFGIYKKKLTALPAILMFLISLSIILLGNYYAFLALFTMFIFKLYSDKIKGKKEIRKITSYQIISNLLTSLVCIILYYLTQNNIFYVIFFCSIAGSFADNLASTFGIFSRKKPINIFSFNKVNAGRSGGVSFLGLFVSLMGGIIMGGIYYLSQPITYYFIFISFMGLIGSLIDSILGTLFEVKYQCVVCNKDTNKKIHCDKETKIISTYSILDNNMVNLLSNIFVLLISYIILK